MRYQCCPVITDMASVTTGQRVINAAAIFRCAHIYVAIGKRRTPLFVCTSCGYQTEELPLPDRSLKRGRGKRNRSRARVLVMPPRIALR